MSIAEELAAKFGARTGSNTVEFLDRNFRAAINEALELAAQEAEKEMCAWGKGPDRGNADGYNAAFAVSARIRALKSPAGPVQPTDTNAAPVDQRRTE